MKLVRLALAFALIFISNNFIQAQSAPNFENGWKPYGSYDGSHLDTVNLMNGNLMLHAPVIPDVPQRGGFNLSEILYTSSKDWQVVCVPKPNLPGGMLCSWKNGGSQLQVQTSVGMTVRRTLETIYEEGTPEAYLTFNYSLTTMDGATHQLAAVAGSQDSTNSFTKFDTFDLTGYHVEITTPDANGVGTTAIITDRHGMQYQGTFLGSATGTSPVCRIPEASNNLPSAGGHAPMIDDSSLGAQDCSQVAYANLATDSNGNQMILTPHAESSTARDTLGRIPQLFITGPAYNPLDPTGCGGSHPFYTSTVFYYIDPNGATQPVKLCYSQLTVLTAFNQLTNGSIGISEFDSSTLSTPYAGLTTVILADGTKWTFDYDNYGELIYIGLPTGGSITYTWTTINFAHCDPTSITPVSRAVATRTLNDGQGHTEQWHYAWGTAGSSGLTNVVTDPLGNDTVHIFTSQIPTGYTGTPPPGCYLYETSTLAYQGAQGAGHLLQRSDTTYASSIFGASSGVGLSIGNVFATDVLTTVYPSGKVKKVHKDPDAGPGGGLPIFGNVKKEIEYDWGQGAPGALLRETDTTYQWETNSAYLTAHLLDQPASVIIKDGSGNRVAETDYTYDEAAYLTSSGVTTQHLASPPYTVRGNQSTVSHWLNTTNSFISSHTNWYDTGEVFQKSDPLGHTTTYSYDPAYVGGYVTETCSPPTNSVAHCVSGTYDFTTGVLTSLTNENATTQASGNTQGDSAHTSNYSYDYMFRITSAQAPPDSANSGARTQNTFTFSAPNVFPLSMQRTKSITNALSDSATSFFDGLGRSYKSQHAVPGNTATVDTTFDAAGHPATVSNPYFSTADPTYGITTSQYDALDRVTQVTKQDGSISSVSYNVAVSLPGNCTDTADEAGKQRRTCSDALGRLVEVDEPNPGAAATTAQGTITINGTEQGTPQPAVGGTGSVIISGTEGTSQACSDPEPPAHPICHNVPDGGTIGLKVGTYTPVYVTYGSGSSGATLAYTMQQGFHNDPSSPVDAAIDAGNSTKINFTARGTGAATNYALTFYNDVDFSVNSFGGLTTLTGGRDASGPDAGTVSVTVNGTAYSTTYGFGDTKEAIATRLASAITAGTFANASAAGNVITVTARSTGQAGDYAISAALTYDRAHFAGPSFTTAASGSSMANGYSAGDVGNQPFVTLYQYDALGNLLRVDQKGTAPTDSTQWRTRTFTYDSLSRLLTATNPESGTISYVYDADGSLLQKTSPAANQTGSATQTVSYCYDELHRVTGKGYGAQSCPLSSPVVSYAYDSGANAKGKLVSLTDQAGTASYTYDTLGRLTAETRSIAGVSKTTGYSYNLDGSVKTLTYPSGRVVTYTPDSAGRLISAADGNGTNYVVSASYNPDGSLKNLLNGSTPALNQSFQYTPRLQMCRITALTSGTLPTSCTDTLNIGNVMDRGYDFHAGNGTAGSGSDNGNVFGITNFRDANRSQAFTYDILNRLTSGWSSASTGTYSWGENYSIDAWGNLQISPMGSKAHGGNFTLSGNAQNRPTGLAYDAAGNLMSYVSATYTYDQENRLLSTAGMSYTYDGNGERMLKSNSSTGAPTKRYWSMGSNTLAEGDGSGNLTAEYIYFGSKRIARIDLPANTVHYYLSDHLGSTSLVASSVGAIEEESDYYPFGTEMTVTGPAANELKFTGKRRDSESQMDYFGARYYGNVLGRFISADPITVVKSRMSDPQQFNLYAYVRNNPLRFTDSTGMIIDSSKLSDKDKKKFQHIRDIANQTGKDGNLLHPVLHDVISKMDADSRTFVVENSNLDNGTAGKFTITDFTPDGKDFTKATVQMDFKQINGLSGPFPADLVSGFNKYQGLFGVKDENGLRLAETFGHEAGGHGIFAINNPAQAVAIQKAVNDTVDAISGAKFPYPPDVMHKIETSDKALVPTERYSQQVEQQINKELQPKK